jgi:hypothetical protein
VTHYEYERLRSVLLVLIGAASELSILLQQAYAELKTEDDVNTALDTDAQEGR